MKISHSLLVLPLLALLMATPVRAEEITYFEDPIYEKLNAEDHHPMEDMILLAEAGDTRAQFILGDLFAKGKGGLGKSEKKAREWFDMAARQGNHYAFIRLAALAKHKGDWVEAYQWYDLAVDEMTYGPDRDWAKAQREKLKTSGKVSKEDIDKAEDMADTWKSEARKKLAADRELMQKRAGEAEALDVGDKPAASKDPKKTDAKAKPAEGEKKP